MATNNTIKLADTLISYIKTQLCGELTADNCRLVVGKSYLFQRDPELGDFQCSPRGVKLIPKGEDFMDLTWSKFIKFCRENGLIKEESDSCNPKPARNAAAAVTTAAPAATPTAETSTILESAEDAAASIHKLSSESTQASPSAPCSPVDCGTAAPLACADSASATATAGFDYSGLDLPTVDTLHLAERMIAAALRERVQELEAGKDAAADELAISKQIVSTVEGILRARFQVLDSLDYDTFEAAVEPFEALRDQLNEALEVGRWPGKENG